MIYKNTDHLYFTIKGVKFLKDGIKQNKNGSWTVSVKNCNTGKFKNIGFNDLEKLLKNNYLQ